MENNNENSTRDSAKSASKSPARSWILIALVGLVVYSFYKMKNRGEEPLELTQAELNCAIDEGRVNGSLERVVNRDDGVTYLTGEIRVIEAVNKKMKSLPPIRRPKATQIHRTAPTLNKTSKSWPNRR